MLITRPRRAWNVPILLFAFGMVLVVFSSSAGLIAGGLLGGGALVMALGEFRVLTSVDDRVPGRGGQRTVERKLMSRPRWARSSPWGRRAPVEPPLLPTAAWTAATSVSAGRMPRSSTSSSGTGTASMR